MDLSIVIVNYNVKYFLEQCLHSVYKSLEHLQAEVFVVDNNSVDSSTKMIREKFPQVNLIENKENLGFSKANNQALKRISGKYCLLLNPDTLVEEDTFLKCIRFMDSHPDAGALGVKMINGKGKYLPESKRSLPTPLVAFYKIFGFSAIFPHSKLFGKYHLGYLNNTNTHEVEILSGAFMFIRSEALNKTGLLDENFFMYGEDIDLSYRLINNGYKNYYFPSTTIIHFKGESTKKGSINYVFLFYSAMIIFAKKHFSTKNASLLEFMIKFAIFFRAFLAILKRLAKGLYQPAIDTLLIFYGFCFLTPIWEKYRFGITDYYPEKFYLFVVPCYTLIWIASLYFSGAYRKPIRIWKLIFGILSGTVSILVIYALLPDHLRFSRALVLFGTIWAMIAIVTHRLFFHLLGFSDYEFVFNSKKRIVIVGSKEESARIENLLRKTQPGCEISGTIGTEKNTGYPNYLGSIELLSEIISVYKITDVIFCAKDITSSEIIKAMTGIQVEFKIAPPKSMRFVGSGTPGDLFNININSVGKPQNQRKKRFFDIVSSSLVILLSPFLFLFIKHTKSILKNAFKVFSGNNTWVGYDLNHDISNLPSLKKGVFYPLEILSEPDKNDTDSVNIEYSGNYSIYNDLMIILKNIFKN